MFLGAFLKGGEHTEKLNAIKNGALAAFAACGSALLGLLGGWDAALECLLLFMAVDYVSGLVLAGVFHCSGKSESGALESRAGFKGLLRKGGVLALVLVGAALDRTLGSQAARNTLCLFFTANEGISILENLGLMGVRYPAFLRNMLEALRDEKDK